MKRTAGQKLPRERRDALKKDAQRPDADVPALAEKYGVSQGTVRFHARNGTPKVVKKTSTHKSTHPLRRTSAARLDDRVGDLDVANAIALLLKAGYNVSVSR